MKKQLICPACKRPYLDKVGGLCHKCLVHLVNKSPDKEVKPDTKTIDEIVEQIKKKSLKR